jgi:mannose-6-phosphate isomerase-like protein (cupin superfamily)
MPERIAKPWGFYEDFERKPGVVTKRIAIAPGKRFSLQRHQKREERWVVISGYGVFTIGESTVVGGEGTVLIIPKGVVHRAQALGDEPLEMVEVQTGECDEADIERLEDDFGRK